MWGRLTTAVKRAIPTAGSTRGRLRPLGKAWP